MSLLPLMRGFERFLTVLSTSSKTSTPGERRQRSTPVTTAQEFPLIPGKMLGSDFVQ